MSRRGDEMILRALWSQLTLEDSKATRFSHCWKPGINCLYVFFSLHQTYDHPRADFDIECHRHWVMGSWKLLLFSKSIHLCAPENLLWGSAEEIEETCPLFTTRFAHCNALLTNLETYRSSNNLEGFPKGFPTIYVWKIKHSLSKKDCKHFLISDE